jgi:8-oxo-dGTP pyrophosphatase MutT (NUDIX family)
MTRLSSTAGRAVGVLAIQGEDAGRRAAARSLVPRADGSALEDLWLSTVTVQVEGELPFGHLPAPGSRAARTEAIAVGRRLVALTRGLALTGPSIAPSFAREAVAAVRRLALFHGVLSANVHDALDLLRRQEEISTEEAEYLQVLARGDRRGIEADPARIAAAVSDVWERASATFSRRGIGEVRWDGEANTSNWDLSLPQSAAMTVTEIDGKVLMLRRPPSDYLYPGMWTIPGGYLEVGEQPWDAAPREVLEETGIACDIRSIGDGRPLVSDRLAAFPFVSGTSRGGTVHLSEHSDYALEPLDSALRMGLTPEARLVLELYAHDKDGPGE